MARSTRPPVTPEGNLRNYQDELLLAALTVGLVEDDLYQLYDDLSSEGSKRALQRLAETLGTSSRYGVLVWAHDRKQLDLEVLMSRFPKEGYRVWLAAVAALEANPLQPEQVDFLIGYVDRHPKTLDNHWSKPDGYPMIKQILDLSGLLVRGRRAYAMVLTAAASLGQVQWSQIPGPETLKIRTKEGVTVALSGPPGPVQQTLQVIKQALGLSPAG